jgi:hypothetical protein
MKIALELTDDGISWVVSEPIPWTGQGSWIESDKGKVQVIVVGNAEHLNEITEYVQIGLVLSTQKV